MIEARSKDGKESDRVQKRHSCWFNELWSHSVIILSSLDFGRSFEGTWDTGGLWCDPHSRRSHWVLNLELFHVWNMQHHASHYAPVTMQLHTSLISCVVFVTALRFAEVHPRMQCFGFRNQQKVCAARNPTNTGGTVHPCQGQNTLHRCQEGARDERIPVIFESVFKYLTYSSNIACLYNQSCIEYQLARLQNDFYLPSLLNQLFCLAVA